jgi:hypothetical protein
MASQQPSQLASRLQEVWKRENLRSLSAGALVFVRWSVPLFFLAVYIDWLANIPAQARGLTLLAILATSVYKAWLAGWRAIAAFDAATTALKVEKHYGGLDSLLVTAVQHGTPGSAPGTSESLRYHACQMAEDSSTRVQPEQVIPFQTLRKPAIAAIIPVLALLVLALVEGPFLGAGFGRFFAPWLNLEYPTRTQLALAGSEWVVKEGDPVRIEAKVFGEIPATAKMILKTGSGNPVEKELPISGGTLQYSASAVFRDFEFKFLAGDARGKWHTVKVVSSPKVTKAEVALQFPGYTRRPAETLEALTMTLPEGTRVKWKLTLDRAVKEAGFHPSGGEMEAMDINEAGNVVTLEQVASQSRAYHFSWVGNEHGFAFESPRFYLQVAPDWAPSVELVKPGRNLIATMERDLDFAFLGRDDHGIGKAEFLYRLNKSGEEKVELPEPSGEGIQTISWNYREALPDLAVGDTLTVSVEVQDSYPGKDGPHRARSDTRRILFLSKEAYLAQIEKQKRRLVSQVRGIYREERGVHDLIRGLEPSDDVFVQTCQLEAVRQDLMRTRLAGLHMQIDALVEDLAANNLSEDAAGEAMVKLGADLQRIADKHVGEAATLLRGLASFQDGADNGKNPSGAIHMVNSAARELGLVVLQLGFHEASDVMAREFHATAQTQASLRLQTILLAETGAGGSGQLSQEQGRLASWLARLLAATPKNKESTPEDALVAFDLSRLTKKLAKDGADAKMQKAAALLPKASFVEAAKLQAEVIAALLQAEFRLRNGAEYEALEEAHKLFTSLANGQQEIRLGQASGNAAQAQALLHRQLRLMLMPGIPAPMPRLHDGARPPAPEVNPLLAKTESALESALSKMKAGELEAAALHQQEAEANFTELAGITRHRMEQLAREPRMRTLVTISQKAAARILMLEERLLLLLETTEDAADDGLDTTSIARMNEALAKDVGQFRDNIVSWNESLPVRSEEDVPLVGNLSRIVELLLAATPLLQSKKAGEAVDLQDEALGALEETSAMVARMTAMRSSFLGVLVARDNALLPSPKLAEIETEQEDLYQITKAAKPGEYSPLIIPQKNLVHAVNAILATLDPLAHEIESGTVLLFAKEDMDAAAVGLEEDDLAETLDAQSFVVESLQELRAKVDAFTPQYRYVFEINEHLYEHLPQVAMLRSGIQQLVKSPGTAPAPADLKARASTLGQVLKELTGMENFGETTQLVASAIEAPAEGRGELAEEAMDALLADTEDLQLLMKNLAFLITPPPTGVVTEEPSAEMKLLGEVLDLAAHHMDVYRDAHTASPDAMGELAKLLGGLAAKCEALLPSSGPPPALVAAHKHMAGAVNLLGASNKADAIARQRDAVVKLRHFIVEYALKYVDVPPPPPPEEGAPSDDAEVDDMELELFMPGALTGRKPKGGRMEWQVLGRRDRAALNENFARELPLEYRAILKDYYQKLAQ